MASSKFFAPTSRSSLSLYLALRLLIVGSCSIAGFIFCYLIWQHNNHYCSEYDCSVWQKHEALVPKVYIFLVTAIVAAIVSAFVLSYRQLSFFVQALGELDPINGLPTRSVRLPTPEPEVLERPMPVTIWLKALPGSISQTALVIDLSILVIFALSWQEYSQTMILGPVIPYCTLWKYNSNYGQSYWQNLKVIDKECILSQCSWTTCLFVMGFMLMVVFLDVYYVHKECEEKRVAEAIHEALDVVVGREAKTSGWEENGAN